MKNRFLFYCSINKSFLDEFFKILFCICFYICKLSHTKRWGFVRRLVFPFPPFQVTLILTGVSTSPLLYRAVKPTTLLFPDFGMLLISLIGLSVRIGGILISTGLYVFLNELEYGRISFVPFRLTKPMTSVVNLSFGR